MGPVIEERDVYMAKTLAAAANGGPAGALTPAYVPTVEDNAGAGQQRARVVFRYAQPEGGNPAVCPVGGGDGVYAALSPGRVVVGVVGTAHVRGIIRAWAAAQGDGDLSPYV